MGSRYWGSGNSVVGQLDSARAFRAPGVDVFQPGQEEIAMFEKVTRAFCFVI